MAPGERGDGTGLDGIPDLDDAPVVWDQVRREFVPHGGEQPRPARRHVVVPAPGTKGTGGAGAQPPVGPPPRPRPARSSGPPAPQPTAASGARGPRRRGWPKVLLVSLVVVALSVVALLGFGWWQFSKIDKVVVSSALSSPRKGTNYLIVGTDSREGISQDDPNSGAFLGESSQGARTDTIMVLRIESSRSYLLSIPRDLWVQNPSTGEMGRINSTFQNGPATLIHAVAGLGIPVDHYMEINFVSFSKIVDALGGITVTFDNPARDTHSGLDVPVAGDVHMNGTQSLAFVRSRYYEEQVDGVWRTDPTADLGRVQRQRAFLSALVAKTSHTWNPLSVTRVVGSVGTGMKIDDKLSYFDALALVWRLRSFDPESMTLPVTPRTTSGGAAVLELKTDEAAPLVALFSGS